MVIDLSRTPFSRRWNNNGALERAGFLPTINGRAALRASKIAPGDFVEQEAAPPSPAANPTRTIHKKTPRCGAFSWMARLERFELPTAWFVARYSIQLSYRRLNRRRDSTDFYLALPVFDLFLKGNFAGNREIIVIARRAAPKQSPRAEAWPRRLLRYARNDRGNRDIHENQTHPEGSIVTLATKAIGATRCTRVVHAHRRCTGSRRRWFATRRRDR